MTPAMENIKATSSWLSFNSVKQNLNAIKEKVANNKLAIVNAIAAGAVVSALADAIKTHGFTATILTTILVEAAPDVTTHIITFFSPQSKKGNVVKVAINVARMGQILYLGSQSKSNFPLGINITDMFLHLGNSADGVWNYLTIKEKTN